MPGLSTEQRFDQSEKNFSSGVVGYFGDDVQQFRYQLKFTHDFYVCSFFIGFNCKLEKVL